MQRAQEWYLVNVYVQRTTIDVASSSSLSEVDLRYTGAKTNNSTYWMYKIGKIF